MVAIGHPQLGGGRGDRLVLTDELLKQLRYKGEGSDLDYKSERPTFIKASDDDKSELL
ncbi:hypothetical protein [Xanthomonas maliensis]|uniref:hypothetical protein n=1 Tax=Xanthomonas maliensis TaxID=1321368 RepID=UPI0014783195|nr:hypothetical protein [Xanthomonas maliensis]